MKKNDLLYGLLIGLLLGVLFASAVMDAGRQKACPEAVCLGESEVIPVSDRGYFDVLHKELMNAKMSIHIVSFEMKHYPSQGNRSRQNIVVEDLIAAKNRGLDVRVYVDEFSGSSGYEYLKKSGVDIRFDSNKTTTHAKVVIIDGRIVLLGSTNFSYYSFEKNNEANVLIFSERIAGYFEAYFQRLWEER